MDNKSLAHTTWNCKYHIVFAPKYRRQIIYNQIKAAVGKNLRQLCERKGVEIIEATACPDHIHMLEIAIISVTASYWLSNHTYTTPNCPFVTACANAPLLIRNNSSSIMVFKEVLFHLPLPVA